MKKNILLFVLVLLFTGMLIGNCATSVDKASTVIPSLPPADIQNDNSQNTNAVDPMIYGAKADGAADDGVAIQKAIDSCAEYGGGIVVFKKGTFLSSPLVLKTGVYLKIEALAVLKAVPYVDYPNQTSPQNFITANKAANFGIFGTGTIDGNGQDWWNAFLVTKGTANELKRPRLIYFNSCSNIIVKDVTLQNSPTFHVVPNKCKNVILSNITIKSPDHAPNTDGIDPSGSSNVFIDGCKIDTGDDNIAVKAGSAPAHNLYITNCAFYHGHGLSIGSETNFGVQDIYVQNCTFSNTTTGIRIKSPRKFGGLIQNIHYSNIRMENVKSALVITAYYPKVPTTGVDVAQSITEGTPQFKNISIDGMIATATRDAGMIIGLPESLVQGLTLTNVTINSPTGLVVRNAQILTSQTMIQTTKEPDYIVEESSSITSK